MLLRLHLKKIFFLFKPKTRPHILSFSVENSKFTKKNFFDYMSKHTSFPKKPSKLPHNSSFLAGNCKCPRNFCWNCISEYIFFFLKNHQNITIINHFQLKIIDFTKILWRLHLKIYFLFLKNYQKVHIIYHFQLKIVNFLKNVFETTSQKKKFFSKKKIKTC